MDFEQQPINPEHDDEVAMAKADLFKLAKYSIKLYKMLPEGQELESWVQAKITKAADYIASVYHAVEYDLKQSDYGKDLDMSDMYSESVKRAYQQKLMEAKSKMKKTGDDVTSEGAGTTLRMKAKNRVNVANTELKKSGTSLSKDEKNNAVKKVVATGIVNPKSTYKSPYDPKKAAKNAKEYKKQQEKKVEKIEERIDTSSNRAWKDVDPQEIAALIQKYFETHGKNIASVDLARWLQMNHRIGKGDTDTVRRNLDRMLAKKEFHHLNPQRMFGLRDRY